MTGTPRSSCALLLVREWHPRGGRNGAVRLPLDSDGEREAGAHFALDQTGNGPLVNADTVSELLLGLSALGEECCKVAHVPDYAHGALIGQ